LSDLSLSANVCFCPIADIRFSLNEPVKEGTLGQVGWNQYYTDIIEINL